MKESDLPQSSQGLSLHGRRLRFRVILFGTIILAAATIVVLVCLLIFPTSKTPAQHSATPSSETSDQVGIETENTDDKQPAEDQSAKADDAATKAGPDSGAADTESKDDSPAKPQTDSTAKPQPTKTVEPTQPTQPVKPTQPASNVVYLTFDDGPSEHTARLLDVLKKYNVKVTFFVTCHGEDGLIQREYNDGHVVALHTCSHDYAQVYASDDAFFADLTRVQDRVKRLTGQTAKLMRFPGGSSNTVSARYNSGIMSRLVRSVGAKGFTYFDWNVSSGDAGNTTSSAAVYENVTSGFGRFPNGAVVLQHDTKGFSVDAVERIIKYGKDNGYVFKTLDSGSYAAHHGVNN